MCDLLPNTVEMSDLGSLFRAQQRSISRQIDLNRLFAVLSRYYVHYEAVRTTRKQVRMTRHTKQVFKLNIMISKPQTRVYCQVQMASLAIHIECMLVIKGLVVTTRQDVQKSGKLLRFRTFSRSRALFQPNHAKQGS